MVLELANTVIECVDKHGSHPCVLEYQDTAIGAGGPIIFVEYFPTLRGAVAKAPDKNKSSGTMPCFGKSVP